MKQKGGHGLKARIKINDIPQAQIDILNRSTFTVEIRDTQTGVLESSVTRPMRSFTANFLRLLWGRMTGTACTGGLDINDTAIDESSGKATNLKCVGPTTGLKKFGICIGTGTGAVAQTDNKLTWDTGFTTYGATTLKTATVISGSDIYFEIQKAFTNNTGSTRTIYEAGLCTTGEGTEADNNTNVLIAREITNGATGTAVATGKTLTVVFKISSTFTTDGTINKNFMNTLLLSFIGNIGKNWSQINAAATGTARSNHQMCVYDGKLWVIGGTNSGGVRDDVYYSEDDGLTWTQARASGAANGFVPRRNHTVAVFVDPADGVEKMWVIGGYTTADVNSVYKSTDGKTWTLVRADGAVNGFTKCRAHAGWVYSGKMWVGGGVGVDDVYYSTDGINWTAATTSAAFGARFSAGAVVYDGKMWIIGGSDAGAIDAKVYYSTDGATWTQATASAAFGSREGVTSFVYNGKMWVGGGRVVPSYFKNFYYSTDGVTWTEATNDWGLGNYVFSLPTSVAVSRGKIVIVGGNDGSNYTDKCVELFDPIFDLVDTAAAMNDYARIDAASGSVYGITVGTGTGNFVGYDVALGTPIADGSGASQLDYGDMTDAERLSEPTVTGSDNIMRLERDFANNSGGSITIKEVGLSAKGLDALGLLLMRGKVDKAVADGASVRVAIELETTV